MLLGGGLGWRYIINGGNKLKGNQVDGSRLAFNFQHNANSKESIILIYRD